MMVSYCVTKGKSSQPLPPIQPPQRVRAPPGDDNSLPEAVASLHAAIQKIKINERAMKTLLEQTKSVLESKISEIDQHLEKTDMITTNVDSTTRSLAQLQTTYSWLQVKLQVPPSVLLLSPPQRLFILFIMFFGSLWIVLGVNRDRALDKTNTGEDERESERKNNLCQISVPIWRHQGVRIYFQMGVTFFVNS